jgi:hypothetical protein
VVLGPDSDPPDEPRDSSAGPGAPQGTAHEDLKRAAESAVRLTTALGEVGLRLAARNLGTAAKVGGDKAGRTAKALAKWLLI